MNITNIETIPFYSNIEALNANNKKIPEGLYLLVANPLHNNYILQKRISELYEISFKTQLDKDNLDNQFARGHSHICHVKSSTDTDLLLDVYFFTGDTEEVELSVLIDEQNADVVGKQWGKISENCYIRLNDECYFIAQGDFSKKKSDESEDSEENGETNQRKAFSILCENGTSLYGINIKFSKINKDSDEEYPQVTNIRKIKNANPQCNYHLFKGRLTFTNERQTISVINQKKFESLYNSDGSYLKAWERYTCAKGDKILKIAREFNKNNFGKVTKHAVGFSVSVSIKSQIEKLGIDEVVVYSAKDPLPLFLQDTNCNFLEYCSKKEELGKKADIGITCKIISVSENLLELEPVKSREQDFVPNDNGYFVMSMAGEESQVKRQEDAWKTIKGGNAGIRHLNFLLEGKFDFLQKQTRQKKYKISPRVRAKVFENDPTDKQLEAIEIALQTPDIALIQGPPGTGKTTVITAILEILNEAQDKRGICAGRVLATSYQHDAVENMIERIRINSLPTYKYGQRRHEKGTYREHIDSWCKEVEKKALEKNPELDLSNEEDYFYALLEAYHSSPLEENKINLLDYVSSHLPVSNELANRAELFKKKKSNDEEYKKARTDILRKAYSLRITENSFKDDGKKRLEDLYYSLMDLSFFDEYKELESFIIEILNSEENFKEDYVKICQNLQTLVVSDERFNNKPQYVKDEVDEEIISYCEEISQFLQHRKGQKSKKDVIISEWIKNLETGSRAFEKAIKDCDYVYSATSQQTEGREIKNQKMSIEPEKSAYLNRYDTVIIDEAARATPPDLLIPMCKAYKRIILVGDHRQLPQLVDEDICNNAIDSIKKSISGESTETKNDDFDYESAYQLSLFENLFNKLKELEQKDGIKRTITLDKQYRTHPLLGKFASREFYEIHPGEGYDSPRKEDEFKHNLPGIANKAAIWIDVPNDEGHGEEKLHPSYRRSCEADVIIDYLSKFTESQKDLPDDKKFSFGIITFYKGQYEYIENELNKPVNKKKFRNFKIKVGTVDAFQGMQFDVVFLSVVRTNKKHEFGFLTSVNRMCVSMTRQKKALIVVGDREFVTSESARMPDAIPALAKFYDLCESSNEYGAVL